MNDLIISVFFDIDNFCNEFEAWIESCEKLCCLAKQENGRVFQNQFHLVK